MGAVPCNNKSSNSIGLMWWLLAREVMPDLFFYRDPEEVEREEAAKEAEVPASKQQDFGAPPSKEEWGGDQQGPASDWANEATVDGAGGVPTVVDMAPVPVLTAMPTY